MAGSISASQERSERKRNDSQVNDTVDEKTVSGKREEHVNGKKTVANEKNAHAEIATVSRTTNL